MKILGEAKNRKYICEVSHQELEKFLNQYYGNLKSLSPGDEIDLGKGYNFLSETKSAVGKVQDFIESNKLIIEAIINGVNLMGRNENHIDSK